MTCLTSIANGIIQRSQKRSQTHRKAIAKTSHHNHYQNHDHYHHQQNRRGSPNAVEGLLKSQNVNLVNAQSKNRVEPAHHPGHRKQTHTMTEKPQPQTHTPQNQREQAKKGSPATPPVILPAEIPAIHPALALLRSQPVTEPHSAAMLLASITNELVEKMPEGVSRRLGILAMKAQPVDYAQEVRDRKAAELKADAARLRERAAEAEVMEARTRNMSGPEYAVHIVKQEAADANRFYERQADRAGAITVSHWADWGDSVDVQVKPSELKKAGYHHHTKCGSPVTFSTDHDLIRSVWQGLLDHHDRAHGLTSWTNCPDPVCLAVPEAFRAAPWTAENDDDED